MSAECKTLEAYLAPPTQYKQRKLHEEYDRYESLLNENFDDGCDTTSAVHEIVKASTKAVEYASQFENPVIVLEYLDGITDEDIWKYWNRRLGKWLFSRLQHDLQVVRSAENVGMAGTLLSTVRSLTDALLPHTPVNDPGIAFRR